MIKNVGKKKIVNKVMKNEIVKKLVRDRVKENL